MYKNRFLKVQIYSLPKFYKKRSSAIIRDYADTLNKLDARINSELFNRNKSAQFNSFTSRITRFDTFTDIKFVRRRKSDMQIFYNRAVRTRFTQLPYTTSYEKGFYWHNEGFLEDSTEFLKLYWKENHKPRRSGGELNKYKLRLELSLQNLGKNKVIERKVKELNLFKKEGVRDTGNKLLLMTNDYKANVFSLVNESAVKAIFFNYTNQLFTH